MIRLRPSRYLAFLRLEEFEIRLVPAGYFPTDWEQVFLERLNDARANPAAYGASIGLDLPYVAPSQPLAFNDLLLQAARDHSLDMSNRNYFSHNSPEGVGPGQRIANTGFQATGYAESIAAGYPTPESALAALIRDDGVENLGHRRHLLAIDSYFATHRQIGIGIEQGGIGRYRDYYTLDTASQSDSRPFLTGLVMREGAGAYDPGDGLGGVTIVVSGLGTTTTTSTGGYSFRVNPGTYTIIATGGGLSAPITQTVSIGADNLRLIFSDQGVVDVPPPDLPPTPAPVVETAPVAVVNTSNGAPQLFALGLDDQVYSLKMDAAGNPVGGYFLAAPGKIKKFVAGSDVNHNPILYAIGLNDRVYGLNFDSLGNPIGDYFFTAEGAVQEIVLGHDAALNPQVFVIGLDDQVYAQRFNGLGRPNGSGYFLTQAGQVKDIQIGNDGLDRPELFAIGLDDQVYGQRFDGSGLSLGPYFLTAPGQVKSIAVGHDAANNPQLFAIGLDDQVYYVSFNAQGLPQGSYFLAATGQVKEIRVAYDSANRPEIFVIGLDDQVYSLGFQSNGTPVGPYKLTQAGKVKSISTARNATNHLLLFAIGLDDQVYGQKFDGNGLSISDYYLAQSGQVK